jgi:RNA polymerase sigma-70 factor, ECF subfamily
MHRGKNVALLDGFLYARKQRRRGKTRMKDNEAAHLGRKLREMFEATAPEPLPPRLAGLLAAIAAKDRQHPPVSKKLKNDLIALIPNLRAFTFSLCSQHERADDRVQETLLKAYSRLDSFQEGTNLRAWLFKILRNCFFSDMRKRRTEVEDAGKKAESLSVAPAQQGHVDIQDLRKALDLLPPHQREAVVLVGAAGMSYEEAAESCKVRCRNHEEPGQPSPRETRGALWCRRRSSLRPGLDNRRGLNRPAKAAMSDYSTVAFCRVAARCAFASSTQICRACESDVATRWAPTAARHSSAFSS